MNAETLVCKICQSQVEEIGRKPGKTGERDFTLYRCPQCHFSFVGDPRRDFVDIYSGAYYRGRGIDPFIDYVFELENADNTVRGYEWAGILKLVKSIYPQPIDAGG